MMRVLFVLCATVWTAGSEEIRTCSKLPSQVLNFNKLVVESPWRVVYSSAPSFTCASVFYTHPTSSHPQPPYTGASTYINKTSVLANVQLKFSEDKLLDNVTSCSDGSTSIHQFLRTNLDQSQGYCIFTCSSDGSSLAELKCMDKDGGFDEGTWAQVMTTLTNVPGAPPTHSSLALCTSGSHCEYFD